jgi:DNA-binding transcriptional LysR family regulator
LQGADARCLTASRRANPQLTKPGRTVLPAARVISNGINGVRAKVRGLLQGLEAEIPLVRDVMLPAARVVDALKAFRAEFPRVSLRLYIEALGAVTQMVLDGTATIGIGGPPDEVVAGIENIGVGSVDMIPVELRQRCCWLCPALTSLG